MRKLILFAVPLTLLVGFGALASPRADDMEQGIHSLQTEWALAKYGTAEDQQDTAFTALGHQAARLSEQYPGHAEPLVWQAIIESTHAGVSGAFSALSRVKHARELLEQAEKLNPQALQGSIYTSLGCLYYQAPGWPLAFGDDDKAEVYLKKALAINPTGIDPNYFYGDFLRRQDRYAESVTYLEKALQAPDRPQRPLADKGRREEARQALAEVRAELNDK